MANGGSIALAGAGTTALETGGDAARGRGCHKGYQGRGEERVVERAATADWGGRKRLAYLSSGRFLARRVRPARVRPVIRSAHPPTVLLPLLVALLLATSFAPTAAAQDVVPGPPVTVLVHHPYPDDADPLGFPYPAGNQVGYWMHRHRHLDTDRDGFDFPSMVADGIALVEGLPDPQQPYASTRKAYEEAFDARSRLEPALSIQLGARHVDDTVLASVAVLPRSPLGGESLRLMVALTEDPVRYVPPAALSNGVFDHRFTVRAVRDLGVLDLATTETATASHTFLLDKEWQTDRLSVAAWLQQDGVHGTRFAPNEVAQATQVAVGQAVVQQDEKGVLLELWSATWCDPCLYGDTAFEDLAVSLGAAEPVEKAQSSTRYFQPPALPVLVAGAAIVAAWLSGRRWQQREAVDGGSDDGTEAHRDGGAGGPGGGRP